MTPLVDIVAQDTIRTKGTGQSIPDTLLFKIQKAQSIITEIKAASKKGYGITRIRAGLADVKATIAPVSVDLKATKNVSDAKSLTNYSLILNDAQAKLTTWRTTLSKSNNDIQSLLDQVLALSTDSLLIVAGNDTTEKKFYADQLTSLKLQLQDAGKRTSARLDTVSRLLADVSGTSLRISNLQTTINERVQKSTESAFQKEASYLWEAPTSLPDRTLPAAMKASYEGQNRILNYFFASSWDNLFLLVLLTGLFFVWVFTNYKTARKPTLRTKIGELHFKHLRPVPIVGSLLVLLNLTPLFEPQSPSIYIEIAQFLLYLVLTIHLWKRFSSQDRWLWLLAGVFYILLSLTNAVVSDSLFIRLGLIGLNAGFLYLGLVFANRFPRQARMYRFTRPVIKLYLLLQGLAILLNIFGRISLAKTLSISAVIGLIQLTGLSVFIELVLEALALQITISACAGGIFSRVNVNHTQRSFKKGLIFVAIILWLLVFFTNLGVADSLFNLAYKLLTKPRWFGSISFTLSNVLSFSAIIYLSSLLQKRIGLLFGESQLPTTDDVVEPLSSILALIRLVIIIAGVLLAIAASGISIDKFTVVLGALSVGIGLGMQNIVSNFVSGIILIFEKPFQIGDYVELADKKGRIREIGIRSSKMLTAQGSEVIIPNGDLIANRIVNWTSNDTYLKTEITLKVNAETDLHTIRELLREEVSQLDGALKNRTPELFITAIGPDTIELKVQVWINSIYTETALKSQLLERLLKAFKAANIQLL
ncbi:mechanosensitive ion channel family protein [Spirosoma foliorum]|nr:mechanosensitive ion channel domain-containing protein [Spirosoma foliorum]